MCRDCRWADVAAAIDADLERRVIGHTAMLLDQMAGIIRANEHVTPEQRDAVETVLEPRDGAPA